MSKKFSFDEATLRILVGDDKVDEMMQAIEEAQRVAALEKKLAARNENIAAQCTDDVSIDEVVKAAETLAVFLIGNAKKTVNGAKRHVHKIGVPTEHGDVYMRVTL